MTTLAVTDHDTVAGLAEAMAAARALGGIEIVAGIEVSTSVAGQDIHVLGHFVDPNDAALLAFTKEQEGERRARMMRMVVNLNGMGIPIEIEEVDAVAGSANLCRPHLARALLARGVCHDMQDAFTRFLGDDAPAFSAHRHPDAAETIRLLHAAGGVATLAHPASDGIEQEAIRTLKELGLDGLEIHRADLSNLAREKYLSIAYRYALIPTGGSDFHEDGDALGKVSLAPSAFAELRARATARC